MKIFAPTKINLALDILGKTSSGFHKIQTIYHQIDSLTDEIKITRSCRDIILMDFNGKAVHSIGKNISTKNLISQALSLIKKTYKINKFIQIKIKKNIPFSSGLGGVSSDAAAILKGLNKFWGLNLSQKELLGLAEKLGMDVPFFIVGGTALGAHFGEKIKPLKKITGIKFKINPIASNIQEKTKKSYSSLNLSLCGKEKNKTKCLINAIKKGDKQAIIANIHNDFETLFPVKKGEHLAGSGPSTFTAAI